MCRSAVVLALVLLTISSMSLKMRLQRLAVGGDFDCLAEGGRLIFSVPSTDSFLVFNQNHLLNLPLHHQTWLSDAALKSLQKVFGVKLLDIYQEKVQDIHLQEYVHVLFREILRKFIPCKRRFLTTPGHLSWKKSRTGWHLALAVACRRFSKGGPSGDAGVKSAQFMRKRKGNPHRRDEMPSQKFRAGGAA